MAFTRRGGSGAQVWTGYTDGTGLVQVTGGPDDAGPRWSPRADALTFARGRHGSRAVYVVRADGTHVRRLTFASRDDSSPAWSARGWIAFVRRADDGPSRIYVIRARGGKARRLTRGRTDDRSPAWSPSGRRLAFARGRRGRSDLFLVTASGTHERRVTSLPGDESEPAWSPDGRWIAFTHRRAGRRRLYALRLGRTPVLRVASPRTRALGSWRVQPRAPHWQRAGIDPVVAAAGDIACDPTDPRFGAGFGVGGYCRQRLTSDLLLRMDLSAILAPGDLQYSDGKLWKFEQSFDQSWGRLKPLIRPVPGNHEYRDPGATGYFDYFNGPGQQTGVAGRRGEGFYSFDVGTWHLVALNSECQRIGGCARGAAQERWLRTDLASHPSACTLAFWHHPRFSSGRYGAEREMLPVWNALNAAGVDVIVNGHEHFYERFAPQAPDGTPDPVAGVRQFTVGTGGRSRFGYSPVVANSQVRQNARHGVLKLILRDGSYRWEFIGALGGRVLDAGETACH